MEAMPYRVFDYETGKTVGGADSREKAQESGEQYFEDKKRPWCLEG